MPIPVPHGEYLNAAVCRRGHVESPGISGVAVAERALQGEVTVESRLGNFLLADSFLLLSWATVFSGSGGTTGRMVVLAVLALTSALLAGAFAVLGSRFAKFVDLQWELATQGERQLPKTLTRFGEQVDALRNRKAVHSEKGRSYQLSWLEYRSLLPY